MILKNIPIQLDLQDIISTLHLKKQKDPAAFAKDLWELSQPLLHPQAVFKVAYINQKKTDTVNIDGSLFSSKVLSKNLAAVERVFPWVITIGNDLENKASTDGDLLQQYYLENIGDMVLHELGEYMEEFLKKRYGLEKISSMSPGTLDWPITEQKALFSLIGNVEAQIGVSLSPHMLMIPRKSLSGLYFPTEVTFLTCQLCSRPKCPSRTAPFDKDLEKSYGLSED